LSRNLGAGAAILLRKLTGPDVPEERRVDIKAPINALKLNDFARIVEEFHKWPFAPDVSHFKGLILFDSKLNLRFAGLVHRRPSRGG
jgi:hypothetical protein